MSAQHSSQIDHIQTETLPSRSDETCLLLEHALDEK